MKAKEYLNQLKRLDQAIERKKQELDELYADTTSVGGFDYSRERVQTSASLEAPYISKVHKAEDLRQEIVEELNDLSQKKRMIVNQIQEMDDYNYETLLYKRYVEYKPLEVIADEMGYSYNHIRHMHGWALQEFESRHTMTHLPVV